MKTSGMMVAMAFNIALVAALVSVCREAGAPLARQEPPAAPQKIVDAKDAVRIAERFIRDNGYTEFVPEDASRLEPEWVEFSDDPRAWLAIRRNSLRPKARGYRRGARHDSEGWTIGFDLVNPMHGDPGTGRAVTMDRYGEDIGVEHMGFFLRELEPRPE